MYLATCYKCKSDHASISLWIKTLFTVLASNSKRGRSYYHSSPPLALKGPGRCGPRLTPDFIPVAHAQDRVSFETSCPQISRMEVGTLPLGYKIPRALTLKLKMAAVLPNGTEARKSDSSPCYWVTVFWLLATGDLALLRLSCIICKMELTSPSPQDNCGCKMRSPFKSLSALGPTKWLWGDLIRFDIIVSAVTGI